VRARNFLHILAISLALSAYASWVLAVRGPAPARSGAVAAPSDGLPLIRLAEARALWEGPATLFIDVRSEADFSFDHVPGAIHLPEGEVERRLPELRPRLERASAIVVYCTSPDCGKALWVALRLRNAGLLQTRIFPEGWNEWVTSEQPTARKRR